MLKWTIEQEKAVRWKSMAEVWSSTEDESVAWHKTLLYYNSIKWIDSIFFRDGIRSGPLLDRIALNIFFKKEINKYQLHFLPSLV